MALALQRSFDDLGAPLIEVPFCVLNLETTGGSPATCEITEIGAARYRAGVEEAVFQTLVNPGMEIPPFITVLTGITHAMVVEAPRKSGALLTAGYAVEQNRDVFAVPGDPSWPSRKGSNELIRDGARLVQSAADILAELGLASGGRASTAGGTESERERQAIMPPLSREEKLVYDGLSYDACHVDELAERLEMDVSQVLGVLLRLDMKNLIREHPGKLFSLA